MAFQSYNTHTRRPELPFDTETVNAGLSAARTHTQKQSASQSFSFFSNCQLGSSIRSVQFQHVCSIATQSIIHDGRG